MYPLDIKISLKNPKFDCSLYSFLCPIRLFSTKKNNKMQRIALISKFYLTKIIFLFLHIKIIKCCQNCQIY